MDTAKNAFINAQALVGSRTPFPSQIPSTTRSTPLPQPSSLALIILGTSAARGTRTYQNDHTTIIHITSVPDGRLLDERPGKDRDIHDAWRMEVGWSKRSVRRRGYYMSSAGENVSFCRFFCVRFVVLYLITQIYFVRR